MSLLGTEPWRATFELMRSAWSSHAAAPPGDGHRVVMFPGLGSSTWAIAPMIRHCRRLGYEAQDWGRGVNTGPEGDVDVWLHELAAELKLVAHAAHQTVTLIGWSLGGLYARELAKVAGTRVRQVITVGTPFNADADYTRAGWLFSLLSGHPIDFDERLVCRLRAPPAVPTTSIYSRQDGVVAWQTCTHDQRYSQTQDVEVASSHLGMGWNPVVLSIVADRLAQQPGHWRPFQALPATPSGQLMTRARTWLQPRNSTS